MHHQQNYRNSRFFLTTKTTIIYQLHLPDAFLILQVSPLKKSFFKWARSDPPLTLRKKCPYLELFRSVFFRIQTEYGKKQSISPNPHSDWIKLNKTPNTGTFYALFSCFMIFFVQYCWFRALFPLILATFLNELIIFRSWILNRRLSFFPILLIFVLH